MFEILSEDILAVINEKLRTARAEWKAPRCPRCRLMLFRSPHTGVIYTERNLFHGCELSKKDLVACEDAWARADELLRSES